MPYGRQILHETGNYLEVAADGHPEWKVGGVTIDWATVTAAGADITLGDGTIIKAGQKYLEYGQVLCKITQREVQTITITGSPTGGTFTLAMTRNGVTRTTPALAYNATPAAVQAALEALDNIGTGSVVVSGGPLPGTALTATFGGALGSENVPQLAATGSFTGGTSPAIAVATTTEGTASGGKYGPYASGASDGRQTLARGDCGIVNATLLETGSTPLVAQARDITGLLEGGVCWKARIKAGGSGQPSWSALEAALPRLRYAQQY